MIDRRAQALKPREEVTGCQKRGWLNKRDVAPRVHDHKLEQSRDGADMPQ